MSIKLWIKKKMKLYSILSRSRLPLWFNTLSFLDFPIPQIPIENFFVSSGLNLPFSKGITGTALELGWYKGLLKKKFHKGNFQYQKGDLNKVIELVIMMIMMKNIKNGCLRDKTNGNIYNIKFIQEKNSKK